ncbi:hypothetical protein DEO72_LG3g214 [Vigna unguiculata]|uniref:Uncharacterized protein n=1 Tax=Vigna unguiculata TaxID=3917 RepID=A0A4D6LBD5_VIGUN|nr:hypothetical protein DEO72_LG3g214 [Vigna unguiculata]
MPRFCVEPRPYRLIRAQKQNPFFLARAAAISLLCKFRRPPREPPATTRASCHHHASLHASLHQPPQSRRASSHHHASLHASLRRASSHHHASLHASLHQPPQSRRASSHHHANLHASLHQPPQSRRAAVSSLSLSLCKCSGVPLPPREHFRCFAAIVALRFSLR